MKKLIISLLALLALSGCYRKPDLYLYDWENPALMLPWVDLDLDLFWGYTPNWRAEWYYGDCGRPGGWDDEDKRIFGELEYVEPTNFFVRRYFTGDLPYGPRRRMYEAYIQGRHFRAKYDWGYWDILAWNDIKTIDGVQSLIFREPKSLDEDIIAFTNQTMYSSRYHAPRYQNSFYAPEQLFAACERGIDIDETLKGFVYIPEENMWLRQLRMTLEPLTYIYLPQVIIHHNNGTIVGAPDKANLSGLARATSLNTGIASTDAVSVNFDVRMKLDKDFRQGEKVDIVGGRLMTFGICGQNGNRVMRVEDSKDPEKHYLDVKMMFKNGMDSTFVFDVTEQVRRRYRGGVITVELDMDTVPMPVRPGGSGFNAVVKDYEDGGQWEFEM